MYNTMGVYSKLANGVVSPFHPTKGRFGIFVRLPLRALHTRHCAHATKYTPEKTCASTNE
jgi:hypothetical protein